MYKSLYQETFCGTYTTIGKSGKDSSSRDQRGDQVRQGLTPTNNRHRVLHSENTPRSSLLFAVQASEIRKKRRSMRKCETSSGYEMLPNYSSGANRKPRSGGSVVNPFNKGLVQRMSQPTCSPDLFANVVSPNSECSEFRWTIDDISKIRPADIASPASIIEENIDEQTESQAQEAIEQYFSMTHNVTSPIDEAGTWVSFCSEATPEGPSLPQHAFSTPCTRQPSRKNIVTTVGVQTMLTLPQNLPEEILNVLKPYMNESVTERSMIDECNTSANTLRRKLFFNQEELSPVRCNPNSGIWKGARAWLTPERNKGTPNTPDISPINVEGSSWNYAKGSGTSERAVEEKSVIEIFSSTQAVIRQGASSLSAVSSSLEAPLTSGPDSQDTGFVSGDPRLFVSKSSENP